MTIIHSSDLGWTAGQDISNKLETVLEALKPGDVFVFDHMYVVNDTNIQLADNVTLAGGMSGAGLDVRGTKSHERPLLELGNSNTLVDLTIKHSDTTRGDAPSNNGATIEAFGDDIRILNSSFEGYPKEFIRAQGDNLSVVDTVFDGAFYQMRWFGEATNFSVENSLFQNAITDGIKTARDGSGLGTENASISNSVFINNRDGIDTTGGFQNSTVSDSFFINNTAAALDFKILFDATGRPNPNLNNNNVKVTNSEFIGEQKNFIITSVVVRDNSVTNSLVNQWKPNNISVSDSVFENNKIDGGNSAAWLDKAGSDLFSTNNEYYGRLNIPDALTQTNDSVNQNPSSTRPQLPDSYYQSLAGPDWSKLSFPTDGTSIRIDPVVNPDPISYTPQDTQEQTTKPEPVVEVVVEASAPTSTPVTSASSFLDIFVAYTDTDETISQLGNSSNIDSSLTDGRPLTIYATASSNGAAIGSVQLTVSGVGSQIENIAPYALFGDTNGDFLGGAKLAEGAYTAELIVFSGKNGTGNVLETVSFDFTVDDAASVPVVTPIVPVQAEPVAEAPAEPEPETDLAPDVTSQGAYSKFLDIQLVDASTDKVLGDLFEGAKLSSRDLSSGNITLSAEAINSGSANIGSVKLELDGQYSRIENVTPYALFGDDSKGNFFDGKKLADGAHFATLTVYSGKNGNGSILEQFTVNFEVGNYDSLIIDGNRSTISSYSASQDTGTAIVSEDQSEVELKGSAWKSLNLFGSVTEQTVLEFDFKSDVEGEIQGIGFVNEDGDLQSTFFQLAGSQNLGIQDFNGTYEAGSGFGSYTIPIGQYFTGSVEQLVLISDDDAGLGAMTTFDNINLIEALV